MLRERAEQFVQQILDNAGDEIKLMGVLQEFRTEAVDQPATGTVPQAKYDELKDLYKKTFQEHATVVEPQRTAAVEPPKDTSLPMSFDSLFKKKGE